MSPILNWPQPEPERIKTPIGEAWIHKGIIWHRLEKGTVTEKDALATITTLSSMVGEDRVPAVVDIRGVSFADSEARSRFAQDMPYESATALIVKSRSSRALGNIYMRLSKPSRPTKMFNDEAEAAAWALSHASEDS